MPLPESAWEIAERVFETFPGGEAAFWRAWARGELEPEIMNWFRQHAAEVAVTVEVEAADALLNARARGTTFQETPEDRRRARSILEALMFAVEAVGTLTALHRDPLQRTELRERFRAALFDLLEHDLDIDLASGPLSEAEAATEVLRIVFPEIVVESDEDAPPSFLEIAEELRELRERVREAFVPDAAEEALRELALPLLAPGPEGIGYALEPSFRNYLRARLHQACLRLGWRPRPRHLGGRFDDLDAAFTALSRQRVAEVFRQVGWSELDPWLVVDATSNT